MADRAKEAAARIAAAKAAEINAKLLAKGVPIKKEILLPKQTNQAVSKQQQMPIVHSAEIEINDLDNRGLILKSNIQDQIGQWTGTTLVTRGRYIPRHRQTDLMTKMERPLYIHISAVNKDWSCTEKAIHYVLAVLKQNKVPAGSKGFQLDKYPDQILLKICARDIEESSVPFVEKVYCDMEDQPLPWNIKQEIEGPDGQYINHIVKTTQAREWISRQRLVNELKRKKSDDPTSRYFIRKCEIVKAVKIILRGTLSGYLEPETGRELKEPLFVQINHNTLEGLVEAKHLVDSLLFTVHKKIREKRSSVSPQTFGFTSAQKPTTGAIVYPSKQQAVLSRLGAASAPPQTQPNETRYRGPRSPTRHHARTSSFPQNSSRPDRGLSKRRFQENFNSSKKRRSKEDDGFRMPPPPAPTAPISAGNVTDWIKETQKANDDSRSRGRNNFDKTLVCDYSSSDDD